MVNFLYAVASLGFLIWITRNVLFWGKLLQQHDYSVRNLLTYIASRAGGRTIIFSPFSWVKWSTILIYPIIIFNESYEPFYHLFITAIYITEGVFVFTSLWRRQFPFPRKITPKIIFLVGMTIIFSVILFIFAPIDIYLWLIVMDRGMILLMLGLLAVIGLPEEFYWDYRLVKAIEKRRQSKHVTSLLLLGGRGATISKHLLTEITAERFSVVTTPDQPDIRTITKTIGQLSERENQLFITEFQIDTLPLLRQLSFLISPRFVIVDSLPSTLPLSEVRESLSVFLKTRKRMKPQIFVTFPVGRSSSGTIPSMKLLRQNKKSPFYIERLSLKPAATSMRMRYKGKQYTVETALVSRYGAYLQVPLVGVLVELGYDAATITRLLRTVALPDDFLSFSQEKGWQFLNNTSETSSFGLAHFDDYLGLFHKQRILILDTDIFASGTKSEEVFKLGRSLTKHFQYIFLVTSPAERVFKRGAKAGGKYSSVVSGDTKRISGFLKTVSSKGDFLLFYGPRAAYVLQDFKKNLPDTK